MLAQSASSQAAEKVVIDGFNAKLAQRVATLAATHSGVKTYIWNSYAAFNKILDNPTAYGFKDGTTYGVADNIFWRSVFARPSGAYAKRSVVAMTIILAVRFQLVRLLFSN